MKVKIQSIHFNADTKLLEFIEEKVGKLTQYYDGIIGSDVILRLEKSSNSENKVAEIRITIPGNDLFAKRQGKSFEEAIDSSLEAITTQVKKHKQKVKGL